jgi:N-acetylglutamate synthase-like GNAT family acetyltransferase
LSSQRNLSPSQSGGWNPGKCQVKSKYNIREIRPEDNDWIKEIFNRYWSGGFILSRGKIIKIDEFTGGYIAEKLNEKVGLITYKLSDSELEITGLVSIDENKGIGTALVNSVLSLAKQQGIKRVSLVTTNDNLKALGFWQKRGFKLIRIYPNSIEATRRLKPSLPLVGENNISLRDELELEMTL